jgi:two-component system, chemotaxis family, CheB/CheR fusion protein
MGSDGNGTSGNSDYGRPPSQLADKAAHSVDSAQSIKYAIVTLDRTANVMSWNEEAELLFGHTEETALGKPLYHFLDLETLSPGSVEWELQTAYYRGKSICNRQFARSDGSRFRATAEVTPLWDGEFLGYTLTINNVTRVDDQIA